MYVITYLRKMQVFPENYLLFHPSLARCCSLRLQMYSSQDIAMGKAALAHSAEKSISYNMILPGPKSPYVFYWLNKA